MPQTAVANVAAAVKTGRASAVYAVAGAMGGDGRARLLAWMCATDPALADRGRAELATLAVAVGDRRRIRHNRRSTLRSRARRRAARQRAA